MSNKLELVVEDEAPPLVRVFANTLKLTLEQPKGRKLAAAAKGIFSLQSTRGPQAVTIDIGVDEIKLTHGCSDRSQLVLQMDFNNPKLAPKVIGLFRHPLLAYRIGKLLSVPLPNWADSAKRFWAATHELSDMPDKLIITCTNEERSLSFGGGDSQVELYGSSNHLESMLVGNSLLVQDTIAGKIRFRGTLQHMAGLSQACQKLMLGEING